ncbi:MAG: RodZ domain-containing protein [Thiobacillaceae bacterium]
MSHGFAPGFGAALAAAREAKGLTRNEVAERLKLSPRQIEALEAEDWAALPDPVFVRGFVRNYARLLELDVDALIPRGEGGLVPTQTITAPSAGVRLGGSPVARWLMLPLLLAALFVGGVAALYTWLRQGEDAMLPLNQGPQATALPPAPAPEPVTESTPTAPAAIAEPAPIAPPAAPPAVAPLPPALVSPPPAAAPPRPPASPTSAAEPTPARQAVVRAPEPAAAQPAATAKVSMRFSPTEDAWIQVVDSQGMRFSKLVRAGASEVVSGTPPFKLVVGNAANVSLVYNGHNIDLKPFIGEKVARLTLE